MPSSVRKVTDVPGTEVAVGILVEVGVMVGVEGLSVAVIAGVAGMAESHPDESDKTSREYMMILKFMFDFTPLYQRRHAPQ